MIKDENSVNGTFVNNVKVVPGQIRRLDDGDVIPPGFFVSLIMWTTKTSKNLSIAGVLEVFLNSVWIIRLYF